MGQYFQACLKGQRAKKNWRKYNPHHLNCGAKLTEHSYKECWYVMYIKHFLFKHKQYVVWAGDYADNEPGREDNLFFLGKLMKVNPEEFDCAIKEQPAMRYLVNHTKRLYLDYAKLTPSVGDYTLDPLPLFTAEGNGRGNGDYDGDNQERIGEWARDLISIEEELPNGYTEVENPFRLEY